MLKRSNLVTWCRKGQKERVFKTVGTKKERKGRVEKARCFSSRLKGQSLEKRL